MSNNIKSKLRIKYNRDTIITVNEKQLEVCPSVNKDAGIGVFASEPIPQGTIFLECVNAHITDTNTIDKKINDLAYHGTCNCYDTDENIEQYINVGYIIQYEQEWMAFFGGVPKIYLYALKDIEKGQELSRYYGLNYWLHYEFWRRFPDNKFPTTNEMEDLPSDWVFVDEIRHNIMMNSHMNLFAKLINDQYHYFVSYSKPDYFDVQFADKLDNIVIVTKPDYSMYRFDEEIYNGMFMTQYLETQEKGQQNDNFPTNNSEESEESEETNEFDNTLRIFHMKTDKAVEEQRNLKLEFWKKYPESGYSNDNDLNLSGIPIIDEFPPEYVPAFILYKDGDENLAKYYLYCKKQDGKYYYKLDLNSEYREYDVDASHYYSPNFENRLSSFIDVTKDDYTKYEIHDCINSNMHTVEHHDIELNNRIKKKRQDEHNFWERISGDRDRLLNHKWNRKYMGDIPPEYVLIDHLQESLNHQYYHDLYTKKVDGKYYYLVGTQKRNRCYDSSIQYYQEEFIDQVKTFKDVTRSDYSMYCNYDCILGNLYFKNHLIKLVSILI